MWWLVNDLLALLQSGESEALKFKESWNNTALETLSAFANTRGGILLVGVNDKGEVKGWPGDDRALQTIVSQITALRIQPPVAIQVDQEAKVLAIQIAPSATPIAYQGRYYRRVGNTTEAFQPEDLAHFFIESQGVRWDSLVGDFNITEIDDESVRRFARDAEARLPYLREDEEIEGILEKLELLQGGKLTHGAVLLFGKNPQHHFSMAEIHMGRFKDPITISDDRLLKGNLFQQLDQAMRFFREYLRVRYEFPGSMEGQEPLESLKRREVWDYPLAALREAVVNALVHRDYFNASMDVSIRVYDDQVLITNPGGLPQGVTVEDLRRQNHSSIQRNPLVAQVFYYAQLAEKWGTGIARMIQMCREQGLPEPDLEDEHSVFRVTFSKDPYTKDRLLKIGLSERQIKAVLQLKKKEAGSLTNKEYQELLGVSERTATRDLSGLVKWGIIEQVGRTGKGTAYRLNGAAKGPIAP